MFFADFANGASECATQADFRFREHGIINPLRTSCSNTHRTAGEDTATPLKCNPQSTGKGTAEGAGTGAALETVAGLRVLEPTHV